MKKALALTVIMVGIGVCLASFLSVAVIGLTGCSQLYTAHTNEVSYSVLPVQTNTVVKFVTNTVSEIVSTTNVVTGVVEVQPVLHDVIKTQVETVVTYETNREFTVNYTVSTNSVAYAGAAGAAANMFMPGSGGLVQNGLLGLLGIFGAWMGRGYLQRGSQIVAQKQTADQTLSKVATTLAQGTEVYRNILTGLPNGAAIDAKAVAWLQSHQQVQGVVDLVADVVANNVNTYGAQEVAKQIKTAVDAEAAGGNSAASVKTA